MCPYRFCDYPSGGGVSSRVYILMMRDSLYYLTALLCVTIILGWWNFPMLGD